MCRYLPRYSTVGGVNPNFCVKAGTFAGVPHNLDAEVSVCTAFSTMHLNFYCCWEALNLRKLASRES